MKLLDFPKHESPVERPSETVMIREQLLLLSVPNDPHNGFKNVPSIENLPDMV